MKRPFALLVPLLLPVALHAAPLQRAEVYNLPHGQEVAGPSYIVAGAANVDGVMQDDVFLLGGTNLQFGGHAQGDAWLLGVNVSFSGMADDHVRACGQHILVSGVLSRDLIAAGNTVRVSTNAQIGGTADLLGENIVVEGEVAGRVRALGQRATIAGKIGGDLRVLAQDIVVLPGAVIRGNLVYTSPRELFLDRTVELGGKLIRETPQPAESHSTRAWYDSVLLSALQWLAAMLVGIPFLTLFPRLAGRASRHVRYAPARTLFTGLAGFALLPVGAVFALFTVIGLPLGLVLGAFFGILLYLAKIVVAVTIGGLLLQRKGPQPLPAVFACLAVGLALLYGLAALPVAGGALALLIGILGLGALLLGLLRTEGRGEHPPDLPSRIEPPQAA